MSSQTILFFFFIVTTTLIFIILYQRFVFTKVTQTKLKQISRKLEDISASDSDEKIMVFTDNPVLMELAGGINRLLLERQKLKAEFKKSETASKKMLANISHDIKTPLTVILGYLEIMRLADADDETLIKVEAKAKQVMDLISQFFTLAKLEAGYTNITLSKINISEICRESALGFYEILSGKNFEVEIAIPESEIFAQGEKDALQRILFNLLSNAVRYGSEGKYLGIFLRQDKNSVYIDITDKGNGIEKQFADRVFERLYTMEDSRNRKIQGNGLGLTIAKNLAVQLGGDLYLESTPHLKTTFTVQLKKIKY